MVDSRLTPEVTESLAVRWEPVYRSQLHYLVTWGTRGRRPVLKNRHVRSLRNLVQQLCAERGHGLLEVAAGDDHVHVLLAIRPSQSGVPGTQGVAARESRLGRTLLGRNRERGSRGSRAESSTRVARPTG